PNPPPHNPSGYAWQSVMPVYAQGVTSRYEDLLRNGSLMPGDMIDNSNPVTPSPFYQFSTGSTNKVVIIRKSNTVNKYAITGAIETSSNTLGSSLLVDDAQITLDGQIMKFKIRKQGSTYTYDNTVPSAPVFYQLDGWHESSHPYYWSKDFNLEAELYDNTNATYNLKTTVPNGTATGDFRSYTTFITFPDAQSSFTPIEYVFTPRDASQSTSYLWAKMRSRDGVSTGLTASVDNTNPKTIGCVTDTDWKWYRIDATSQQAINYTGLSLANHTLRLTPANSKVEIDQVVLSTNANLGLTPEGPTCSVNCTATATANGSLTFCQGGNVVLTASAGASYLWTPGNQTTQSITASTSGSYAVTVTQSNGCSATSTPLAVSVNQVPSVVITANGPTTFCAGDSVVLSSSTANSYQWSPGGETTQSITVLASGSYTVNVTDASGCSNTSAATSVTAHPLPAANISASGPLMFFQGDSVILTASPGSTYLWLPDNQTTQSITVTASGSYSVLITDANGCFAISPSVSVVVSVGTQGAAVIIPGGPTTFCEGGNVVLSANTGVSYEWSTGETSQSITVNTTGNYVVTVTFSANTSTSTPVNVVVNPLPAAVITADDSTSFCEGGTVILLASPGDSYLWTPGGETTSYISVNSAGSYGVTVTDNNSCSATSTPTDVIVYALPSAVVTPDGPLTFNQGDSVVLTSDAAASYLWSPGNQTSQSITVAASGTYSVLVTSAEGCTVASSPVIVTVNGGTQDTAAITANGPLTFCEGGNVQLSANTGVGYLWSTGETTQTITVASSGSYVVTVTFASNISTSLPVDVVVNPLPAASVTAAGATSFCEGGSVMLSAGAADSYAWTPGGDTTQSITVSTTGSFAVTITDGFGCSATSAVTDVLVYPLPVAEITASGPLTFNQGDSVVLSCGSGSSYLWQPGGQITQSFTVYASGIYTVQITSADGCTAVSASVTITVIGGTQDTAVITPSGPVTFCDGGNVTLTANTGVSYLWSTAETTQSISVNSSGSYLVTVTFSSNISISDPVNVVVNPLPIAEITASGPLSFCIGGIVDLTSSQGISYLWSPGGETTQTVAIGTTGSYTVNITDINGCSATSLPAEVLATNCNSCPVPTGLDESAVSGDSATLNWDAVTGVDYLQIALLELPSWNTTITPLFSGTATQLTVSVEPNKWYLWWIRSECGNSFTAWSAFGFFTTPSSVRLADSSGNDIAGSENAREESPNANPFEFGIFPNPASGSATVTCSSDHESNIRLQLRDVTGKIIKEEKLQLSPGDNNYQLDLRNVVKGIYVVLINDNGSVYTKRLIID
ncbi:MAG: T9SS type A sorting domain-containing protein, partial [Bacteroidota bacterium]